MPVPILPVLPKSTRTFPRFTRSKSLFLPSLSEFFMSWMKAISSFGIPRRMSLAFMSSYTVNAPSFFGVWGVPISRKTTWVSFFSFVFPQISKTFITALLILLSGKSETDFSISRISTEALRPSVEIFNILSFAGSTLPDRTASALIPSNLMKFFNSSDAGALMMMALPVRSFGRLRLISSIPCGSATSK